MASAAPQEILRVHDAVEVGANPEWFRSFEDRNGDGVDEYLFCGRGLIATGGMAGVGLFDGASGQRLWFRPHALGESGTVALAVIGDIDGDGVSDIARTSTGSVPGDICTLMSGVDGALLGRIIGGVFTEFESVAGLDDVDGDGVPDILMQWYSGECRVISGALPHGMIYEVSPLVGSSSGGVVLGDLDGDGLRDFGVLHSSFSVSPQANVHSAADGSVLYSYPGGSHTVGVNDVDGDGVDDFAVSMHRGEIEGKLYRRISMRSGADGAMVWDVTSPTEYHASLFTHKFRGGGDVNGDGFDDIVTLDRAHTGGTRVNARVLSGRTGAILLDVDSNDCASAAGCEPHWFDAVGILDDLDSDGYAEFGAVSLDYDECGTLPNLERGRLYIFSGEPGGEVLDVCSSRPNSTGLRSKLRTLSASEVGSLHFGFELRHAPPGEVAQLAFGSAIAAGTGFTPLGSGALCFDPVGAQRALAPVVTDLTGVATMTPDWGQGSIAGSWIAGSTWTVQVVHRDTGDPAGLNTSNALAIDFF